jgi:putative intracellular protease/amidase
MKPLVVLLLALALGIMDAHAQDSKASSIIQVALFDDAGSFGKGVPSVSEQLSKAKDISVTVLKAADIIAGLDGYQVVVFTGGSGSKQAKAIADNGREVVKKFVENGGGYIGICAGAYLACDGFSWGLHILDAKTPSSKWMRGKGDVKIELTDKGRDILGLPSGQLDIRYANGPILVPAKNDVIADFEPLAFFRTELAEHDSPKGAMINSPAIVRGTIGKGRVIVSSPHPEQTPGMENFIEQAVRWVAEK